MNGLSDLSELFGERETKSPSEQLRRIHPPSEDQHLSIITMNAITSNTTETTDNFASNT
ncbi:unnamed protein product, partial [Schistosoma turkestanicum]